MRRFPALPATAFMALAAISAASPAEAAFHLIRWQDSGFCQVWNENVGTVPYPANYTVIEGSVVPTFGDALVFKDNMLRSGTCKF